MFENFFKNDVLCKELKEKVNRLDNEIHEKDLLIERYKEEIYNKNLVIDKYKIALNSKNNEMNVVKSKINMNSNSKESKEALSISDKYKQKYINMKNKDKVLQRELLNEDKLLKHTIEIENEIHKCREILINKNNQINKLKLKIINYKKVKEENIELSIALEKYRIECEAKDDNINECRKKLKEIEKNNQKLKLSIKEKEENILKYLKSNKELKSENHKLNYENAKYKEYLQDDDYKSMDRKKYLDNIEKRIINTENEISIKQKQLDEISKQIIDVNDEVLYEEFGLYKKKYDYQTTLEYKKEITKVLDLQKEMIKDRNAVEFISYWGNDITADKKQSDINKDIKLVLRCFNIECEYLINKVKFNNHDAIKKRIRKSFELLNKLNISNGIEISEDYLELKYKELYLNYEYKLKKQEEKEEAMKLREEKREEIKLQKELEERRIELEKERIHYSNQLAQVEKQIENEKNEEKIDYLLERKSNIQECLSDIEKAFKDVDYREANCRAGYVYIISNIGSFGSDVYKIGMTRRLEPNDRIDELSNAAVPFRYDVHAMIFSENAPKLEAALHKAFEDRKLNMVNTRKEFFKVKLDEIINVVNENYDKTVNFNRVPEAKQYRETVKIRENKYY